MAALRSFVFSVLTLAAASGQTAPLSFRPIDAEYSKALDRIIMVSASENRLHIYNPVTKVDLMVTLPSPPTAVSVSPDGLFAAVGHFNLISYVNLTTATVVRVFPVAVNVSDLVLAADYIYLPPTMSIRLSDGAIAGALPIGSNVPHTVLRPGEQAIYWVLPTGEVFRASIATGVVTSQTSNRVSPRCYFGGIADIWLVEDTLQLSCGEAREASADLRYSTELMRVPAIAALTYAGGKRALIPLGYFDPNNPVPGGSQDGAILVFDGFPPVLQGRLVLPFAFPAAGFRSIHGRWIFFDNAGVNLYTIVEGTPSGTPAPPSDFAIYTTSLAPATCATDVPASVTAPGAGTSLLVTVSSPSHCPFQVTSNASWIKPVTMSGGGTVELELLVRPNGGTSARSGTVTIGTQSLTVQQDPAPAAGGPALLGFRVSFAEFSRSQNKLVLVSSRPHELHLIDPGTMADQIVPLTFEAWGLAVSPDGNTAAVSGPGAVLFAAVSNGAVSGPHRVPGTGTLVLPGNGHAYLYPPITGLSNLISISLQTGASTVLGFPATSPVRLQPGGQFAYSSLSDLSGSFIRPMFKWEFAANGTVTPLGMVGAIANPNGLWFSGGGSRLLTSAAGIYRTPALPGGNLTPEGSLAGANRLTWADGSVAAGTLAATLGDNQLGLFGGESLEPIGTAILPGISSASTPSSGWSVFWNAAGDKLYVLLSEAYQRLAVHTISAGGCAANSLEPAASTFTIDGGAGRIGVNAAANCATKANSNAPWLAIDSGGFGIGPSTIGYSVARNNSGAARTGAIAAGGKVFSVTQSADSLTITPSGLTFEAAGGTGSVTVSTSAANVAWSAQSAVPWMSITSAAAGVGNGAVGYSVSANGYATVRTGTLSIGGVVFTVKQAGSTGAVEIRGTIDINGVPTVQLDSQTTAYPLYVISQGPWVAAATADWIHIMAPSGGVGNGTGSLRLSADPNPNNATRRAGIVINGRVVEVIQYAVRPAFTANPTSVAATQSGASGSIQVVSGAAFAWSNSGSTARWLTVSGDGYSGGTTIAYSIAPNPTGRTRTAMILIDGYPVPVVQSGDGLPPGPPPPGLHFFKVQPCRVADTRENLGAFGRPALTAGAIRAFNIRSSNCGIPSTARAYALNLTVVPKGRLGYITVWPTGLPQPLASTLNSIDGRIKANAAIAQAGVGGAVNVYASDATELVIDINGYFADPAEAPAGLAYFPLVTPCRLVDTRNPAGPLGGPGLGAGGKRDFPVSNSMCAIPASAQAYSINATAVPSGPLGYLTLWPAGQPQPFVSTLNAPTGTIVANAAIVPAGAGGSVSAYASGATHLVIDINGYFAPTGSGADALKFYPLQPCRILDTREPYGGNPIPLIVEANSGVSASVLADCGQSQIPKAVSVNATVVPTSTLGYLTLWGMGAATPLSSTLNALEGGIVSNAAIVQVQGSVRATVTDQTHLILDMNGYFAP